eukprot:449483-Rhodomonas_salina.3
MCPALTNGDVCQVICWDSEDRGLVMKRKTNFGLVTVCTIEIKVCSSLPSLPCPLSLLSALSVFSKLENIVNMRRGNSGERGELSRADKQASCGWCATTS